MHRIYCTDGVVESAGKRNHDRAGTFSVVLGAVLRNSTNLIRSCFDYNGCLTILTHTTGYFQLRYKAYGGGNSRISGCIDGSPA